MRNNLFQFSSFTKHIMTKSNSNNILYYNPGSVFSNVGVLLLCEKGIQDQFEFKPIQMNVDNIAPWYISLNPKGQVPTLVHEGKPIPDTLAIASYLDTKFGDSPIFSTSDPEVINFVERWREVRVISLLTGKKTLDEDNRKMVKTLSDSRQQVLSYIKENPELSEQYKTRLEVHDNRAEILTEYSSFLLHQEKLETLLRDAEFALKQNEGHLLKSQNRTVADIYVTGILHWLTSKLDKDILSNRPLLSAYFKEQTTRPSYTNAFK